jgi:hypothetical protein
MIDMSRADWEQKSNIDAISSGTEIAAGGAFALLKTAGDTAATSRAFSCHTTATSPVTPEQP